jgi:hypothetical protein
MATGESARFAKNGATTFSYLADAVGSPSQHGVVAHPEEKPKLLGSIVLGILIGAVAAFLAAAALGTHVVSSGNLEVVHPGVSQLAVSDR